MTNKPYIEIELPNVEMTIPPRGDDIKCVIGTYPFMHPLIETLAVKHPEWRFVGTNYRTTVLEGTDNTLATIYRRFEVFAGKESLGFLYSDYSYGRRKDMYVIRNHRTEEVFVRASAIKTSDLKKAVKHVEKMFYTLTSREFVAQKLEEAGRAIADIASTKDALARQFERQVRHHLRKYIRTHKESVLLTMPEQKDREAFEKAFALESEVDMLRAAYGAFNSTRGHRIVQRGDNYYEILNEGLKEYASDDLTESMRHKLGILKLVEDGQAVEGIGFRHSSDTFILFGDKQ